MIPEGILKSSPLGGFEKHSVESYLHEQIENLNQLEAQAGMPLTNYDDSMLKKVRFGSGYGKESVLTYITMIQQQILMLETIIKN
ncbi:MAG: hypothetical protein E7496_08740 [Ruminococcus sp.]|nr:hypothetical protein [Ruminococcus sp.]